MGATHPWSLVHASPPAVQHALSCQAAMETCSSPDWSLRSQYKLPLTNDSMKLGSLAFRRTRSQLGSGKWAHDFTG